jgi:hypothetical protein
MKLLVATDFNPSSPGGGPSVIRQMLRGFREAGNSILWWSCRAHESSGEDFSVDALMQCPIPKVLIPLRRMPKIKSVLVRRLWTPFATRSLQHALNKWKPDCIWAIPHNWSILPMHEALLSKGSVKIRLHTTIQDYPDIHGNIARWGLRIAKELSDKQASLYEESNTSDATSLPMLEYLEQKTKKRGVQMLHEGLEVNDFNRIKKKKDQPSKDKIKLAFVGTILASHEFAILIKALKMAGASKTNMSLEIWSAHSYKKAPWFDSDWMIEHKNQARSVVVEKLAACDWGCLTMPFNAEQDHYTMYSFPTKFITYLAAGIPTIILGPKQSAVTKMADQYNLGLRFYSLDEKEIARDLFVKMDKHKKEQDYSNKVLMCSQKYFSAYQMRKTLWNCLQGSKVP